MRQIFFYIQLNFSVMFYNLFQKAFLQNLLSFAGNRPHTGCPLTRTVPELVHYSYTTRTLLVHYSYTTRTLLVHYSYTTRTLLVHYSYTTRTLLVHYSYTTRTLLVHYSYTTRTLLVHYSYTTRTLLVHYSYTTGTASALLLIIYNLSLSFTIFCFSAGLT